MTTRTIAAVLLLVTALTGASCNIVGPIALMLEPPPSKDAATELDAELKHVFFVDDRASRLPKRSLRGTIGTTAEQTLIQREILLPELVVPSATAMRVVEFESSESPLSIAEIGQKVGADIVVYLTVDAWTLTRDGSSPAPSARGRVKIIDAANNQRIFPPNETGYPVVVRMPTRPGAVPRERAARAAMEQELAVALGAELAKVFFDHEIDPMTQRRL